jgi:phenylalanyl-tRNA synthetase beta chain
MKISLSWLQQYLKVDLSTDEISELLTDIGLEVEGIHKYETIKGGLKGIVIGKILTVDKHPDADRLNLTSVDVGAEDPLQIVCGAPNVAIGLNVPVATVGTRLYDGDESFKIKRSKIRGQISNGMICGPDEIGLGAKTDGIMELPDDAKVGMAGADYFNINEDVVFEIGLTPNRSDAMSHIGVARDLKAVLNSRGDDLKMCLPSIKDFKIDNKDLTIDVNIESEALCPRYSGVSISNVIVNESPDWLKHKLLSIGINPINNIVDITNYVLHETGQPLHAFDTEKILGKEIVVKTLKKDTNFITLDESKRKLSENDLMICNSEEPMCIAGVFGGLDSGVTKNTKSIFIESAYFDPTSIRKTAKYHKLNTDASFRYERGCDPNITVYALKRAALLVQELCGGVISSDVVDVYPNPIEDFSINFSYNNLNKLIGEELDRNLVKSIIKNLEIKITDENDDSLSLLVPPYRTDVRREVDVIEEVLRIYGFNSIKINNKLNASIDSSNDITSYKLKNIISNLLVFNGFNEVMNNSLTKSDLYNINTFYKAENNVSILNPLSSDLNILRRNMLFSALETIEYNSNRKNNNLKIFEFGKTYSLVDKYIENQHLFLSITGRRQKENWNSTNDKINFFDLKEYVHTILNKLGIFKFSSTLNDNPFFDDYIQYKLNNDIIVSFGSVNNKILKKYKINKSVYVADFNWDVLLKIVKGSNIVYSPVNKFPSVRRDLSLLIDNNISFSELENIAISIKCNILKDINLFDVYTGDKLPENKKSYSLSFIFEDNSKTLTDIQIDKIMDKLIKEFQKGVSAEIR